MYKVLSIRIVWSSCITVPVFKYKNFYHNILKDFSRATFKLIMLHESITIRLSGEQLLSIADLLAAQVLAQWITEEGEGRRGRGSFSNDNCYC